jgi:hypothetical protein
LDLPEHLFFKSKPTQGVDRWKVENHSCPSYELCLEKAAFFNMAAVPCQKCLSPEPPKVKRRRRTKKEMEECRTCAIVNKE